MDNEIIMIVSLIVSLMAIITPILKLNANITKLNVTMDCLNNSVNEIYKKVELHESRLDKLEVKTNGNQYS